MSLPLADGQLRVVVAGGYFHVPMLLSRYLHTCTRLPLADGQLGVIVAGGYSHVPVLLSRYLHACTRSAWCGSGRWILSCTCVAF
jgi:hypothetical protein